MSFEPLKATESAALPEGASGAAPAMVGPAAHEARRRKVLDALGDGALVLGALPVRYKNGDTEYRYRPDSDLFYLTGLREPGCVLVLRGHAQEARSLLFLPERDPKAERWHGARLGPEEAVERFGVDEAHPSADLSEKLGPLLGGAGAVYYRPLMGQKERGELDELVMRALAAGRASRRRTGSGPVVLFDPSVLLDDLRLRKDEHEVAAIRHACELTVAGHRAGLATVGPGRGEWKVEAAIDAAFRSGGAFGPAFGTIVASGPNACVLHHTANDRVMEAGELVLIDAGAEWGFYAGDVTRTVPVSGTFTAEQRALYQIVDSARRAAVATVGPGVPVTRPHEVALERMVSGLVELGILEGEPEQLVADEAHAPFVPHKTSHWLGLDVHDVGAYVVEGEPRPLEPGMVLTVEPGLYLLPETADRASAFAGLGVRIEDDVLVTADGAENLTAALPTAPDAIEALLSEVRAGAP